ncbi:hypothetical protein CDD81_1046 [Ophiocordyceps australis]|uniref:Ribonuclease P protein subunit n=1 Tax=Ophiocordyceps australis TaxID=1399860 RepID=A0A2C5XUK1_9HYPO|nr:hypothetical protein CDD81_1046 [Ophiocordyceps australis]
MAHERRPPAAATQDLLLRAHSPETTKRIYSGKIEHRPLLLKPSSPPPSVLASRAARRKARRAEKTRAKSKTLSSRQRRNLDIDEIPRDGHRYHLYEPLHQLWLGYAREILANDIFTGGPGAAAKLSSAELHGALAQVVRSRCPGRVGIRGIVVRDLKFVMEIITPDRGLKIVPKEGTTFRIEVPPLDQKPGTNSFVFEVLGDQLKLRSADRANKKFKMHFLPNL